MAIDTDLIAETERWLKKIKEKRAKVILFDNSKKDMVKNIDAYISDTKHFLDKKDYIRAFEAVIWAWSWIEILEELQLIKCE